MKIQRGRLSGVDPHTQELCAFGGSWDLFLIPNEVLSTTLFLGHRRTIPASCLPPQWGVKFYWVAFSLGSDHWRGLASSCGLHRDTLHFKGPKLGSWNSLVHSAESIPGRQDVSGDPLEEGRAWEGMVRPRLVHLKQMRKTESYLLDWIYTALENRSFRFSLRVINLHHLLHPDLYKFLLTPISDTQRLCWWMMTVGL